jgi:hypothetical protein
MKEEKTKFIQLWKLGETAVRNPYRITGALKIFKKFFDGGENFSGGDNQQQYEFMEKLLTFTVDGDKITNRDSNETPIADYPGIEKKEENKKREAKQEKARYWVGLMENMGFFNVFKETMQLSSNKEKTSLTEVGRAFIDYPELRNEIWLKQILKRQFPNHKKPNLPLKIRGGWWLIKLILELDGLTRWELSLASATKEENMTFMKKLIQQYRKKRRGDENKLQLKTLKGKYEKEAVKKWFEDDFKLRKKELLKIIKNIKESSEKINGNEINEKLKEIIRTHNSPDDPIPVSTRRKIIKLFEKKDFEIEKHVRILDDWYHDMKRRTIFGDYKDSNTRMLERTGYILKVTEQSDGGVGGDEYRLRISDEGMELITDASNKIIQINKCNTKEEIKNYYEYLVDVNQPSLKTDDLIFLKSSIKEMKTKLTELGLDKNSIEKLEINIEKDPLINKKIIYYKLLNKKKETEEEKFISNMDRCSIETKLLELKYLLDKKIKLNEKDMKSEIRTKPIFMEEIIWYAIGRLGGFVKHVSETRSFHVDSKFRAVFTAAGNAGVGDESRPDMQFHYKNFDEVVEVTTSSGKTQWVMESGTVPEHVAGHQFYHAKPTNGLFIAPTLHEETVKEFWRFSQPSSGFPVKKTKQKINIIPLTIDEFQIIWKKCILSENPSENWIKILLKLHKIFEDDEEKWLKKIQQCIKDFENE